MNLPSLGSHMGLPLPEPSQNQCCLWNQNSTIIHGIKPLRRLTPPPHPFRGGNFVYRVFYNRFSPLKGEMSALLTEGFQPLNNNLPPDSLLDHPGKLIPEPYPGSGVALRQTIIWRYTSGRAMRAPTVTYIETDIIIYNLPDTDNPPLRTTAFRYLKRKVATISDI